MLKQRLLAALVLVPLVISIVFFAPGWLFALAMGAVLALGGWEWCRLSKFQSPLLIGSFLSLIVLSLGVSVFNLSLDAWMELAVYFAALLWLLQLWVLTAYQSKGLHGLAFLNHRTLQIFTGWFLLVIPCWAMIKLRAVQPDGPWILTYLLVLIWVADSAAYFSGKRFGKHKLAPNLSPGKTLEGVAGALLFTALFAWAASFWLDIAKSNSLVFIGITMLTVVFSIAGDLLESMYKREAGLKDSGALIPGHGGVLDRIDSLTAAAPVFYTGYRLLLGGSL